MAEIITVARPYARAIFELAADKQSLDEWSLLLQKLAMIVGNPSMMSLLDNPLITKEQLVELFSDIIGPNFSEDGRRLVSLLAENKRLNLLPAIEGLFQQLVAEREKTMAVKVVSAYPIDQSRLQRLAHSLQNYLQRHVTLDLVVDKSLLGGAIIYAGNHVINGSISNKLNQLSKRLYS